MTTVLAISGSLRGGSYNTTLLREAARLAPDGMRVELVAADELFHVPPYVEELDTDAPPAAVAVVRARVATADALLFATPEYNGSVPGQLKNVVDWASRPRDAAALQHVDAAVVSASTGMFGAIWAQQELRKVLRTAGARVLEDGVAVGRAHEAFGDDGRLRDRAVADQLGALLEALGTEAVASARAAELAAS